MYFALLDDNYSSQQAYYFDDPVNFICCKQYHEIAACLKAIEQAQQDGLFAVGFITYEFAQHYNFAIQNKPTDYLLYFGLFQSRKILSHEAVSDHLTSLSTGHEPFLCNIQHGIDYPQYLNTIQKIKQHIISGDTYQVNFTFKNQFELGGCEFAYYEALRQAQPVQFGACIKFPGATILSRSPELFFKKQAQSLYTRPMKGTTARILQDPIADQHKKNCLLADEKQRAENVMIVDLIRNDLSKIAQIGSVQVDQLFQLETYASVHQMTSSISCFVNKSISLSTILEALFPCGSITGAPKKRTTEIIADLETQPRGVYTGAIGYITPENDMCFNVPIRTLSIDHHKKASFYIGSGIVYDSIAENEYHETLLKGQFIFQRKPTFNILECFFYSPISGAPYLKRHLSRLMSCCQALNFPIHKKALISKIRSILQVTTQDSKIRIEITSKGIISINTVPLTEYTLYKTVFLSQHRTNSADPILRYKTTNRTLYNNEFNRYRKECNAYDVIFCNEKDELTEASQHNIFLQVNNRLITPALNSGLLNGIGRSLFLKEHAGHVEETRIHKDMLLQAEAIILVNSIRGACQVRYDCTSL